MNLGYTLGGPIALREYIFKATLGLPHTCGANNWLKSKVSIYGNAVFLHNNEQLVWPNCLPLDVVIC